MITKNLCPFCTKDLVADSLKEVETFSGSTFITTYQCTTEGCIGSESEKIFWDAEGQAYSKWFEKSDENKLHHKWNKLHSAINSLEWWDTARKNKLVPTFEVFSIKFKKHRLHVTRKVCKGTYPDFYYQFKISLQKQREVKSKRLSQRTIPVGIFAYDVVTSFLVPLRFKFRI